tara:strand:+ start:300 stop:890 length:591 start_codon:yes stop_codon:yes gene_type:complete
MNQVLQAPPVCAVCGAEKTWVKDCTHRLGGKWRCSQCKRQRDAIYRAENREQTNAASARWLAVHPGYKKAHYQENKEHVNAVNTAYKKNNSAKVNSINATRRARRAACAVELDAVDQAIVDAMYDKAQRTGQTVDHIMPLMLQGEHAPWNLRVLPGSENYSTQAQRPTLAEVTQGERRYRLLRKIFENAIQVGAAP